MFQKGKSGNPTGRPKGVKNAKTLLRTAEILLEKNRHPITELIGIADQTTDLELKYKIWADINKYVDSPPKDLKPFAPQTPEESVQNAAALLAELKKLEKPTTTPDSK